MTSPTNNLGAPDLNPLITGAEGNDRVGGRSKALVLDDTNNLLGRPIRYPEGDVFRTINEPSNDGMNYQFPIQLGTEEAQNFMLFKIYNGHSEAYYRAERSVQELEQAQEILSDSSGVVSNPAAAMFADGIVMASGQTVQHTSSGRNGEVQLGIMPADGVGPPVPLDTALEAAQNELSELTETETNSWWKGGTIKRKPKTFKESTTPRIRKASTRMKQTIALYMPHKLNVANFNTYETPDFKLLNQMKGLTDIFAGDASAFGPIVRNKLAGAADAAASIIGAELNAVSAIAAATGKVENPRKETIYQSPELRKFEFSFEFAPRNLDESKSLYEIIKTFKHHAYPSLSGAGYFFNMPAEFELQFYSIINGTAYENVWLNKIARCVLQEINVDYTAAGVVSMFENGAPTNINMTLTFQEVELITQEKVDQGY
jgi:hypothetical protein